MIFFIALIFIWSFLEASFWWVAPDISIGIAYVYFPQFWKRFLWVALAGAFVGSLVTYYWASHWPDQWTHYVTGMRFHSEKNLQYVQIALPANGIGMIKAAFSGIPYKLYFGVAPQKNLPFNQIIVFGIVARMVRFLVTLAVTALIRFLSKPWSIRHPTQLTCVLLGIWIFMIFLVDQVINQILI